MSRSSGSCAERRLAAYEHDGLLDVDGHLQGSTAARRHLLGRQRTVGGLEQEGCGAVIRCALESSRLYRDARTGLDMLVLNFESPRRRSSSFAVGAHADDIEIGCGGLILSLLQSRPKVDVTWVVFSAPGRREREARRGAAAFLKGARRSRVIIKQFKDGHFPYEGAAIKAVFETLKRTSPRPGADALSRRSPSGPSDAVRSRVEHLPRSSDPRYEIPKFDGDLGTPNCFVPLDRATCRQKVEHLRRRSARQRDKHWFSEETFMALMRLRGMECRAVGGYAEAFYGRKMVLDAGPVVDVEPEPGGRAPGDQTISSFLEQPCKSTPSLTSKTHPLAIP